MKRRALENQDGTCENHKKRLLNAKNPPVKMEQGISNVFPDDSKSALFRSTAGHAFEPKIMDGGLLVNDLLMFHKEQPIWNGHPSDGNFEIDLDLSKVLQGVSSESPFTEILLDSPCGTLDTEVSDLNCKPYLPIPSNNKIQDELPLGTSKFSGSDIPNMIGQVTPNSAPLLVNSDTIKTIKRSMKNTSKLVSTFTTLKTTYLKLCKEFNYLLTKFNDNEKIKFELLHENNELRKLLTEIITEREVDRKRANRPITTA